MFTRGSGNTLLLLYTQDPLQSVTAAENRSFVKNHLDPIKFFGTICQRGNKIKCFDSFSAI